MRQVLRNPLTLTSFSNFLAVFFREAVRYCLARMHLQSGLFAALSVSNLVASSIMSAAGRLSASMSSLRLLLGRPDSLFLSLFPPSSRFLGTGAALYHWRVVLVVARPARGCCEELSSFFSPSKISISICKSHLSPKHRGGFEKCSSTKQCPRSEDFSRLIDYMTC